MDGYGDSELRFMDIGNIHVMRKSLNALIDGCFSKEKDDDWLSRLADSQWLVHVSKVIDASSTIATSIHRDVQSSFALSFASFFTSLSIEPFRANSLQWRMGSNSPSLFFNPNHLRPLLSNYRRFLGLVLALSLSLPPFPHLSLAASYPKRMALVRSQILRPSGKFRVKIVWRKRIARNVSNFCSIFRLRISTYLAIPQFFPI